MFDCYGTPENGPRQPKRQPNSFKKKRNCYNNKKQGYANAHARESVRPADRLPGDLAACPEVGLQQRHDEVRAAGCEVF